MHRNESTTEDEATLSVTQVNQTARAAVQEAFGGPVWVRGEVQRLVRSKPGHVYFDLVEKDELRDRVRARVRVALFRDDRRMVEKRLRDSGLELSDDVEVRIAARAGVYVERGEFQLVMHGVDPTFTVGRLAAERGRLLETLAAEGLLRANAAVALASVPLRVGLISSGGTAAYYDVVHELAASPFAWQVVHADVRVQGNVAPRRLARAVREMAARPVDVVVLVRGGGARTDLAAYDSEPLARAIAAAPVPVLTGIGHETDRSVADEVAHTAHRTPTACARALVERVADYLMRTHQLARRIGRAARDHVGDEHRHLQVLARRAGRAAEVACVHAQRDLVVAARRATRAGPTGLQRELARLDERATRVGRAAPRRLSGAAQVLDHAETRLRALDPRRVLERGYTITRDEHGDVVRSAEAGRPDDLLVTEFADGTTTSRVVPT